MSDRQHNHLIELSGDGIVEEADCLTCQTTLDTQYYRDYIARKQKEYGDKFDASDLDPHFIPYFHSETRIKVEIFGQVLTGTVGVTTGWRPAFILMARSSAHGSSIVLGPTDKIIAVKHGRKYVELKGGR